MNVYRVFGKLQTTIEKNLYLTEDLAYRALKKCWSYKPLSKSWGVYLENADHAIEKGYVYIEEVHVTEEV